MQPGIFAQLVVVPLFTEHRILSQVAGHRVNIVKGLPPLVVSEEDIAWFADAHARLTLTDSTPFGSSGSSDTSRAMFGSTTEGTTVPYTRAST